MSLPLLFTFKQLVLGDGFIAGVKMAGRALLEVEDGETWITGVNPVGFAGGGMDRAGAFADFRRGWSEILFDIASESTSFEDFSRRASVFLDATDERYTKEWLESLDEVRANGTTDPELRSEKTGDHPLKFEVVELKRPSAQANESEEGLRDAA